MRVNCLKCQVEYEKESELDSMRCLFCRTESKITGYELLTGVFFVFGLLPIGLLIPFLIAPILIGTDSSGHYYLPIGRKPIWVTPTTLLTVNIFLSISGVFLLGLAAYFRQKLAKLKIQLGELKNLMKTDGKSIYD